MADSGIPAIRDGETYIYFLRAGGFVKIGYSGNWKNRMSGMQVGSPYTIVPLLVLIGGSKDEKKLHSRFRASHFRGEWFHLTSSIQQFIKDNLSNCVAKSRVDDLRTPGGPPLEEIIL